MLLKERLLSVIIVIIGYLIVSHILLNFKLLFNKIKK